MFALHVTLLTDRFAATRYNDRGRAEWPPHPARLFAAMVDALHDGDDDVDEVEQAALDGLADLGPPHIRCSDASFRRVMVNYVPVNDADQVGGAFEKAEGKVANAETRVVDAMAKVLGAPSANATTKAEKELAKAEAERAKAERDLTAAVIAATKVGTRGGTPDGAHKLLPWNRTRQPRTFPAAVPQNPRISYFWRTGERSPEMVSGLSRLASRVARLGHSSSFVQVQVDPNFEDAAHDDRALRIPDEDGDEVLRVPQIGARQAMEQAFERHGGIQPGRVVPASFQRYRIVIAAGDVAPSLRAGGRWFVYRVVSGAQMPAHAAVALADAVRGAVLAHAIAPIPAMISGHDANEPLQTEHLACIPLAFVGHPHADGTIRGFALSLPAQAGRAAEQALIQALGQWEASPSALKTGPQANQVEVGLASGLRMLAERVVDDHDALRTLQLDRWKGPSRRWATVTPVALDGGCDAFDDPSPGIRRKAMKTAEKLIRRSVVRMLNLPPGTDPSCIGVEIRFDPPLIGGAHPRRVPKFQRGGHAQSRRLVHAVLHLPVPAVGPLLIGAGRHFGLGLCLPVNDQLEDLS